MKKTGAFLLKHYANMSGDKKVRIAMDWSALVREVRKAGAIQTHGRDRSKTAS